MLSLRKLMQTPGGKLLVNVLISLASIVFILGVLEIAARIFVPATTVAGQYIIPDPVLGWRLEPNAYSTRASSEYNVKIKINSQGWRDTEHDLTKPDGVYRVLVLGDSYMEGISVNLDDVFARQLQTLLKQAGYARAEVINLGVEGYGTLQETLAFEQYGVLYQPDLVLLAFFPDNDVINNSSFLTAAQQGTYGVWPFGTPFLISGSADGWQIQPPDNSRLVQQTQKANQQPLYAHSRLYQLLKQANGLFSDTPYWFWVNRCNEAPQFTEAWSITERILVHLNKVVKQSGARLIVFTVPSRELTDTRDMQNVLNHLTDPQDFCPQQAPGMTRILNILNAHDIPSVNLLPVFREVAAQGHKLFWQGADSHWDPEGNQLAAQTVFPSLKGYLP